MVGVLEIATVKPFEDDILRYGPMTCYKVVLINPMTSGHDYLYGFSLTFSSTSKFPCLMDPLF